MNSNAKPTYPVNEIIQLEMKKQGITPVDLARRLHISLNSVHYLLKRPSLQTHRLWELSEILKLNLFRVLANDLAIQHPVDPTQAKLEEEIRILKEENKVLKEVIALMGGR